MTKNAVAVVDEGPKYLALANTGADYGSIIAANLGGEKLQPSHLDRIKVPSGGTIAWTVPTLEGEEVMKEIEGIIVYTAVQRVYWQKPFAGGGDPPDCFSLDAVTGQGSPGGECANCPLAIFGTAKEGQGRAQACAMRRLVFLLMPGECVLPVVLSVPPSSLMVATKYLLGLGGRGINAWQVYSKLSLEKSTNRDGIDYAKIKFAMTGRVEDQEAIAKYVQDLAPLLGNTAQQMAQEAGQPQDDAI